MLFTVTSILIGLGIWHVRNLISVMFNISKLLMACSFLLFSDSCGKPAPGCRVKLVDEDAEGNGEICFWGRTVFMGYLNMEDKTKEAFDEEGWLHSGDLGKLDKDGFIYVTGRIKGNKQNLAQFMVTVQHRSVMSDVAL